jgi:hypothetical protein
MLHGIYPVGVVVVSLSSNEIISQEIGWGVWDPINE